MMDDDICTLYQERLYKTLIGMQKMQRAAYMAEHFGARWTEVYEHLANTYPQLMDAPNTNISRE